MVTKSEIKESQKIITLLTFKLGDEFFAADVSKVLNILELSKITKVPKAPAFMKGVINLRGDILPVIDTKVKFGMDETQFTSNTCILVLIVEFEGDTIHIGALVDSVQEVLEIEDKDILKVPTIGSRYRTDFIKGIVNYNDNFIMVLDVEKVFTENELHELDATDVLNIKELNPAETIL